MSKGSAELLLTPVHCQTAVSKKAGSHPFKSLIKMWNLNCSNSACGMLKFKGVKGGRTCQFGKVEIGQEHWKSGTMDAKLVLSSPKKVRLSSSTSNQKSKGSILSSRSHPPGFGPLMLRFLKAGALVYISYQPPKPTSRKNLQLNCEILLVLTHQAYKNCSSNPSSVPAVILPRYLSLSIKIHENGGSETRTR